MTNRPTDMSSKGCYSTTPSRLNPQIRCFSSNEGCPVIDESGTICGETTNLSVFEEFRQIYEECLRNLDGSPDSNILRKRLAPFRKIVDNLWQQNSMLVEAVEELEQEATCQVKNLQNKLDKTCQKVFEYKSDIRSLIEIIRRLKRSGLFDTSGLTFYSLCPACISGTCKKSCSFEQEERAAVKHYNDCISCKNNRRCECNCGLPPSKSREHLGIYCRRFCSYNKNSTPNFCVGFNDKANFQNKQSICFPDKIKVEDCQISSNDKCFEETYNNSNVRCKCEDNNYQEPIRIVNIKLCLSNDSFLSKNSNCCCELTTLKAFCKP